jgi:hypothetical protein
MAAPNPVAIFAPRLNETGLRWMAVGSIASNAYGEFRVTLDVDIILLLEARDAKLLTAAFPEEKFYCPPTDVVAIEAARSERGYFNLIDHETGFKADIYLAADDSLMHWAFEHRREITVHGTRVWIAPPEYIIVGKLEFFREGGSDKHLRDIRGILAITDVDQALLEKEITRRGLTGQWERVCS